MNQSTRRNFLTRLGIGAGAAALVAQAWASLRALLPNVSYDPPTTVKLGALADFTEGMRFFPDERLFVFREGKTFHAISAVCSHLGCTVRAETVTAEQKTTQRFLCPCHGSKYDGEGKNVAGPAPRPLTWHPLKLAVDDGQLVVDLAKEVDRDFRLSVG